MREQDKLNNIMASANQNNDLVNQMPDTSNSTKSFDETETCSSNVKPTDGNQIKVIPGKPYVEKVSTDCVWIEWDGVDNFSTGDTYQVRFENTQTGKWDCRCFDINRGQINELHPDTAYVFKVRLVMANGEESKYSEKSDEITTKKEIKVKDDRPGRPSVATIYTDNVVIFWDKVKNFCEGDTYQVCTENTQARESDKKKFKKNFANMTGLQPGTSYVFRVRLIKANGEKSKYSEKSEEVTTHPTFASKLIHGLEPIAKNVEEDCKGPNLYELPMKERMRARNVSAKTRKYDIGQRGKDEKEEKTIMLVGQTGSGKSTLVDGIVNYVLGVRLEDSFRFTVTQKEDRQKQKYQNMSQTEWVSCYTFNPQPGTRLAYRLNVIDTPGFGDVRGLERDHETVGQIRDLFKAAGEKGIQTIDAVCFIIKAPDARLDSTQKYIFQAIMSLFGKDIEKNICTLITFADGSRPPVLDAVRAAKLPFGKTFTFNNSALLSDPSNTFTSMFWEMGLKSFEALFNHFTTIRKQSIMLTREVLQERERLEVTCQNLQIKIKIGLSTIQKLNAEMEIFEKNKAAIEDNKDFIYEVVETRMKLVDLPPGIHTTNCYYCHRTCHDNCVFADDKDKQYCAAMNHSTGYCNQCSQKCHWSKHKNTPYRIDYAEEKVQKTYQEKQKKYLELTGKMPTLKQVLDEMEAELEKVTITIEKMVNAMTKCNNRLKEIALRPNPLETVDMINLMIKAEEDEGKAGFLTRINVLQKFRELASIDKSIEQFKKECSAIKGKTSKRFWEFWK